MEDMKVEIKSLIKVWFTVYASLIFCYFIVRKIPKGPIRLISLLPILTLFTLLPFNLSSIQFGGVTTFFISWLANFKLLLFAFNKGPLSANPSLSLLHFISIACLPIKVKPQLPQPPQNIKNKELTSHETIKEGPKSIYNYAIKVCLLALLIHTYNYKHYMNSNFLLALYCCHIYLSCEIILAMTAAPARALLGFDIELQFDEPYLSTSLQDFWGRRWNLMVSTILRPTIYDPIRSMTRPILGRRHSILPAIIATFTVSGLMHEFIFYSLTRVKPTWEVTWFFIVHGVCLALEIVAKKTLADKWQLHRLISGPLVIGFVASTSFWLFFPQFIRNGCDEKGIKEYSIMMDFVKEKLRLGFSM